MGNETDGFLVVAGDAAAREALLCQLTSAGCFAMAAPDVPAARALLGACRFDRVVFDAAATPPTDAAMLAADLAARQVPWFALGERPDEELGASGTIPMPLPARRETLRRLGAAADRTARAEVATAPRRADPADAAVGPELHLLRERCKDLERRADEGQQVLHEAQEAFNQELSRMMNLVSSIMDGIVFTDAEGTITLLNPVAEEMLGLRAFMAVGRNLLDLEEGGDLLAAMCESTGRGSDWREVSKTVEVHTDDQDLFYIRMRVSRVVDYRGEVAGTLIQLQDVTAEYKTDQLKNQYLSIVAHELRTPLTGIKTFSSMMAKGTLGPMNDKQARVMESIREQSVRLEHQIDKLVNLGHIESNEFGQDLETFDVADLVEQSVLPFRSPAAERDVSIVVRCDVDEGSKIEGDRADLRRALQAIVENAVKFTADGGHVVVEVEPDDAHVRFSISDDGVGIDPRYHKRIFEKFFQVEDPLTRHHGGSGLGLFFVKSIVEAHGATVRVDSKLGNGARFSFVLPRIAAERADEEAVATGPQSAVPRDAD